METSSRRKFLNTMGRVGLVTMAAPTLASFTRTSPTVEKDCTILFQGDSITDGNRGRNEDPNHIMGHGYAFSIASRLGADYPERNLKFINKGISGNTVADLEARWQQDTLDLKPDVLSILVGVNDVYFFLKDHAGTLSLFEERYNKLLQETTAKLSGVLLVLGEPFVARVGMVKGDLSRWQFEIQSRQEIVKELAKKYNAVWLGYQQVFDRACEKVAAEYWIWDGIHPTVAGHELMSREWITQVSKRLPAIAPRK